MFMTCLYISLIWHGLQWKEFFHSPFVSLAIEQNVVLKTYEVQLKKWF